MRVSHPLLALPACLALWVVAMRCLGPAQVPATSNPLALKQSAYGSQIARLMKNSLHNYWHEGRQEKEGAHHDHEEPHDNPAAGRLKLLRPVPKPEAEAEAHHEESLLAHLIEQVDHLEDQRTERNSPFATSAAHRRFLTAAADSQLFQAYQFDPCDAALYEIAHYTALTRAKTPEEGKQAAQQLAGQTLAHALAPTSGMAEALTGAGAMINLFNDLLQPDRPVPPDPAVLRQHGATLDQCLKRYHAVKQQAESEGWWQGIPAVRRSEIEAYASMLERLTGMVRKQLADKQVGP